MARVPCDLSDLLNAARQRLVAAGVLQDAQAFLTLDPNDMLIGTVEPPIAGLSFEGFQQREDTITCEAAPDEAPVMEGELTVALWSRVALDTPGADGQAITNATLGMSTLARNTMEALNNVDLVKGSDIITWRSLTYLGVKNRGRWAKDKNWRRADVRFDVTFQWKPLPDVVPPPPTMGVVLDPTLHQLLDTFNDTIREPGT